MARYWYNDSVIKYKILGPFSQFVTLEGVKYLFIDLILTFSYYIHQKTQGLYFQVLLRLAFFSRPSKRRAIQLLRRNLYILTLVAGKGEIFVRFISWTKKFKINFSRLNQIRETLSR